MIGLIVVVVVLLGMVAGMYQCVYRAGGKGFEAENFRSIIETGKVAEANTTEAFQKVDASLVGEREKVTSLSEHVVRLNIENERLNKERADAEAKGEKKPLVFGPCDWDSKLPWPDLKIDTDKIE